MPFERKSLKGPKGLVIQGPDEHIGESRYHWIERTKGWGRTKEGTAMILRIEKMSGTKEAYDCHSPIVSVQFAPGGLWIDLHESQILSRSNFRQFVNPYCNAIAGNPPSFLIGTAHWKENQLYTLHYATNAWGDFLIFELQPRGKSPEKKPHQLFLVNLWAIFGMAGLNRVTSDGALYFGNEMVGRVPTKNSACFPFFADVTVPGNFSAIARAFQDFQEVSAERAFRIARGKDIGTDTDVRTGSPSADADIFDVIGECTFGDRPSETPEQGLQWAKRAFAKLFPEAV